MARSAVHAYNKDAMERVTVLVGWALPTELMERIGALDPRVRLLNDPSTRVITAKTRRMASRRSSRNFPHTRTTGTVNSNCGHCNREGARIC